MDDADLECIDKYLAAIRDVVAKCPHSVRRVAITWRDTTESILPELTIDLAGLAEAVPAPGEE